MIMFNVFRRMNEERFFAPVRYRGFRTNHAINCSPKTFPFTVIPNRRWMPGNDEMLVEKNQLQNWLCVWRAKGVGDRGENGNLEFSWRGAGVTTRRFFFGRRGTRLSSVIPLPRWDCGEPSFCSLFALFAHFTISLSLRREVFDGRSHPFECKFFLLELFNIRGRTKSWPDDWQEAENGPEKQNENAKSKLDMNSNKRRR